MSCVGAASPPLVRRMSVKGCLKIFFGYAGKKYTTPKVTESCPTSISRRLLIDRLNENIYEVVGGDWLSLKAG